MQDTQETTTQVAKTTGTALDRAQRAANRGLRIVKDRARKHDRVGETTYWALRFISEGLGTTAGALRRLGEATQPPARTQPRKKTT
jgi:hypothetical protein